MLPEIELKADTQTIEQHLSHITRRWIEFDHPCLLEIVYLTAENRAEVRHVAHYTPDADGIALAASDVAAMNKYRINAYATVNPVDANNRPKAGFRAKAEHIVGSVFHWADADDAQAAANIKNFVGPKCTFYVITGTVPCVRPHVYWELEEVTRDKADWEITQKGIAATLATDSSVTDPPRIMRLAGTINWPKPQKLDKGYMPELVTLKIFDTDERPPVSSDRMRRTFAGAVRADKAAQPSGFDIDTGPQAMDRERARIKALSGTEWNIEVFRLVGSYVRKGLSDSEIHALTDLLTLGGYTVAETRTEVQAMINRTRANPNFQDTEPNQFREMTPDEIKAIPAALFRPWTEIDLTAIPYPHFVYSDFYARGYTSVTLAAPKVGKSMLGLVEAVDMATGWGLLTGVEREPQRVVYYNAEDDQHVINSRVAAILSVYGIPQSEIIGRLFATSGVEADDFYMVSGQEAVINEALFVSIEKFCEEQKADALIFDPLQDLSRSPETNEVFRALGGRLRRMANKCNVALGLIHHTRKVAPGVSPSIDDMRGGSALRGTARFNRILVSMTEDEAAKAGVENHRHYFRIGDMESNLAPPSADVNRWFEKKSVATPNGQHVGAVVPWAWPDAFDGVSVESARKVQAAITAMGDNPPRLNVQSKNWVGYIVANILGVDADDAHEKERLKSIISAWIKTGVLVTEEVHDARNGRPAKVVMTGTNNLSAESRT